MLKALFTSLTALVFFGGCNLSSSLEASQDDRFDLARFYVPSFTDLDARYCIKASRNLKNEFKRYSDDTQFIGHKSSLLWVSLIDRLKIDQPDYAWKVVSGRFDKRDEGVDSLLFQKNFTSSKKAEVCGEVAGEVVARLGFLPLDRLLVSGEELAPGSLESSGMTTDKIDTAVLLIQSYVRDFEGLSVDKVADCAVVSQYVGLENPSLQPFADIWVYKIEDSVRTGAIDPNSLSTKGTYWNSFENGLFNSLPSTDNWDDTKKECHDLVVDSVQKAQGLN